MLGDGAERTAPLVQMLLALHKSRLSGPKDFSSLGLAFFGHRMDRVILAHLPPKTLGVKTVPFVQTLDPGWPCQVAASGLSSKRCFFHMVATMSPC